MSEYPRCSAIRDLVAGGAFYFVVSLLMLTFAGPASADRFTTDTPSFCAPKEPVRDFGLSSLPPVSEVPDSAEGLGYGAVDIYGGDSRVLPQPFQFGYGFSEHTYTDEGARLDWQVSAQLWTIDRHGAALREVDRAELRIGQLRAAHQPGIYVDPLPNRRGFYRFDMQIANRSGEVIGSYGAHFKVVAPSWRPRLQVARKVLQPGERLLIRLENYGSEAVSYGESFAVQRMEEGGWFAAPELPRQRWRKWLGFLGPGGIGRCNELSLPAETPVGRYRIVKRVGTESWPDGRVERLIAPFDVLSAGVHISN